MKQLGCFNGKSIEDVNKTCDPSPEEKITLESCHYYYKNCSVKVLNNGCILLNPAGQMTQQGTARPIEIRFSRPAGVLSPIIILIQGHEEPYHRFIELDQYVKYPGEYEVNLEKVVISRLPDPYPQKCTSDGKDTDIILESGETYTRSKCYHGCALRRMFKECGAVIDLWKKTANQILTSNATKLSDSVKRKCLKRNMQNARGLPPRLCNCPFACSGTFYNPTFIKERDSTNKWSLNIRYEQLRLQVIQERAQSTLSDMLSTLGGLLGLLAGMSFLSLIEIIFGLFLAMATLFYRCKK